MGKYPSEYDIKGPSNAVALASTSQASYDCRSDHSSTPETIDFENKSGKVVRIRGCQNGYACKPYKDCVLGMADGASAVVTLDKSFKYFVITYQGMSEDTELYPDANLKYPSEYDIKGPSLTPVKLFDLEPRMPSHRSK